MNQQQRAVVQQTLEMANATLHEALEHIAKLKEENAALRQLLEQPEPVREPVACAVCNEIHAILDADESKIIRDAKDGYPDGRRPRTLTLQERITALCVYASDWKRWCLEKENTTPPAQPAVLSLEESLKITKVCCGDYANCHAPCTPRGRWQAHQEPAAWVGLTDEEIEAACAPLGFAQLSPIDVARAIEQRLKEKNT